MGFHNHTDNGLYFRESYIYSYEMAELHDMKAHNCSRDLYHDYILGPCYADQNYFGKRLSQDIGVVFKIMRFSTVCFNSRQN